MQGLTICDIVRFERSASHVVAILHPRRLILGQKSAIKVERSYRTPRHEVYLDGGVDGQNIVQNRPNRGRGTADIERCECSVSNGIAVRPR